MKLIRYLILSIALFLSAKVSAQDNDEAIRLNPELGSVSVSIPHDNKYPYIRYDLNKIDMNGDDWSELSNKLRQTKNGADFTIVNIGDSHVQADGGTGTTRKLFQSKYGDAGRGIIIPFKLAGTNEPADYTITSSSPFTKATLMRQPWATKMGFTGVALHPQYQQFSFNLKIKSECGYFTILSDGDLKVERIVSGNKDIPFETDKTDGGVYVSLEDNVTDFTITMSGNDVNIYGFDLRNDGGGVLYQAIGNNGAAYWSYNNIAGFGKSLSALSPDLVIISLGTNEAFGKLDDDAFTAQMASVVRKVRSNMPGVKILLVTPSECQKSVYTGGGRSYQINSNVERVRNLIIDYGKKNHIPVYDFYAVAGGEGASNKWLADRLLNSDRIHRTWDGYRLDGTLIYEALEKALK